MNIIMSLLVFCTGDTGLRGPVGEPGIKGIKGKQGAVTCLII